MCRKAGLVGSLFNAFGTHAFSEKHLWLPSTVNTGALTAGACPLMIIRDRIVRQRRGVYLPPSNSPLGFEVTFELPASIV